MRDALIVATRPCVDDGKMRFVHAHTLEAKRLLRSNCQLAANIHWPFCNAKSESTNKRHFRFLAATEIGVVSNVSGQESPSTLHARIKGQFFRFIYIWVFIIIIVTESESKMPLNKMYMKRN